MKIALLTDGIYPYVMGGMQKHSYYLAKYLAKNKVYVDLFHLNQSNLDVNKLEIFTDDEKKYINSIVIDFPKSDNLPGHYIRESYTYSELIYECIKPQLKTYDFIYSKGFSGWKLIEEKKKGLFCPAIGVNFHGYEMFQVAPDFKTKLQHYLFRKPVKWISQNADVVFSYGGGITEIIKLLNVPKTNIIEIPTGIESEWLNTNPLIVNKVRHFVFLGRYERRKGIQELSSVLKQLFAKSNFVFEFIGPIPKEQQIKNPKIIYHGSIRDGEKIKSILKNADVLVCPSYSEGMPNVIMEAMASGLAIIATDVGAVNLMVNVNNGVLIQPNSTKELKSAFIYFLNIDNSALINLKTNSIETVKANFLWKNVIASLISKIEKLKIKGVR